jgi:hypothetical protein
MEDSSEELSPQLAERMGRAEELAGDERLMKAFNIALRDEDVWRRAEESAERYLEEQGVGVPDGLQVRFLRDPMQYPGPDYEFFIIRMFRCRSYWVKKKNAPGYEQVTVCLGFEIVPHPISPVG